MTDIRRKSVIDQKSVSVYIVLKKIQNISINYVQIDTVNCMPALLTMRLYMEAPCRLCQRPGSLTFIVIRLDWLPEDIWDDNKFEQKRSGCRH